VLLLVALLVPAPVAATTIISETSAIAPGTVDRSSMSVDATYDVTARLGFDAGTLSVTSNMTITNRSGGPIDRLELNAVVARIGAMEINKVTVDGREVTARIDDQTIYLPLGGILADDASAFVRIAYRARFQSALTDHRWLFARLNGVAQAYRWLPWISRARPFDRPNHGDPFFTPVSQSVRVAITTDRPMVIATSGRRVSASGLTQTFEAKRVRDFNFAASPFYRTSSAMVGTTRVTAYYPEGAPGATMLQRATWSLQRLGELAGPYPHPTYSIAWTAGGYGMESPAHTWIAPVVASNLPYLVAHETAHQWFYGRVGSDQAREPFADEAMTDYLARFALGQLRSSRCSLARLDLTIYAYSSACYYEIVYIQGGNLLEQVRLRMGNASFWAAVKAYVKLYDGKLSRTITLLHFLDDRTSADLSTIYRSRFPSLYD
jgi:hypothetical protein